MACDGSGRPGVGCDADLKGGYGMEVAYNEMLIQGSASILPRTAVIGLGKMNCSLLKWNVVKPPADLAELVANLKCDESDMTYEWILKTTGADLHRSDELLAACGSLGPRGVDARNCEIGTGDPAKVSVCAELLGEAFQILECLNLDWDYQAASMASGSKKLVCFADPYLDVALKAECLLSSRSADFVQTCQGVALANLARNSFPADPQDKHSVEVYQYGFSYCLKNF